MSATPEDDDIIEGSIVEESTELAVPSSSFTPDLMATDYTNDGVPTFDYVRDQIESRFATSLGSTELAGMTPEATAFEDQFAKREQAGKDKLEEIRRSMRGE
jgi:phage shock protein A